MKPVHKKLFFLFIFCQLTWQINAQILPAFGGSRTGTTGFQFLKISPDAYSSGIAEATIASESGINGLFWNPASIAAVDSQRLHLSINHLSYFAGINMESVGTVYRLDDDRALGFSLIYLSSGEMDVTTEFHPFGTGQTFSAVNLAFGVTYAQFLTDNFNYGLTAKFVQESIAGINTSTAMFDFGFQYDVGISNLRFAVNLSNFGFSAKPNGEIPVIGLEEESTASEFQQINSPTIFRLGLAYDIIKKEKNKLTLLGQLNHPTDNNETFNLAAEYNFNNLLYLRTGYQFGQDEFTYPSAGLGLKLKRYFGVIDINYAFTAKERLGQNHRISFGFAAFKKKNATENAR